MSKVWVAVRGEYSDQYVCAVFTDETLMKEFEDVFPDSSIEEFMVNESRNEKPNSSWYCVETTQSGDLVSVRETYMSPKEILEYNLDWKKFSRIFFNNFITTVNAAKSSDAIKIANDRRAFLKSETVTETAWDKLVKD